MRKMKLCIGEKFENAESSILVVGGSSTSKVTFYRVIATRGLN